MFDPDYNNLPLGAYQTFVSRPDLRPPLLNVNGTGTPGLVLFNHRGFDVHQPALVIADHNGDIIYVNHAIGPHALDFDLQHFNSQDYLTFWNGELITIFGSGNYYMMDDTLNIVANISSISDWADCHEFNIIGNTGTAVTPFYYPLRMNLTKWGGPVDGHIYGSGIRHIDLKSGKVLFEWRCTDHVSPDASLTPIGGREDYQGDGTETPTKGLAHGPWDYFHINSVDMHPTDGTYLVSARHTSSIYKINGTGDIIWTMTGIGGKASGYGDFHLGPGTTFSKQHHARWRSPSEISFYNNAVMGAEAPEGAYSRGLRVSVDTSNPDNYTVSLIQELFHPSKPLSLSQGSLQYLPNGNYWLGLGDIPLFVEFSPNGEVLSSYQTSPKGSSAGAYRTFKTNFTTNPDTIPDVAVQNSTVFMSWNGATRVKYWSVYSGRSIDNLSVVKTVMRTGFETNYTFPSAYNLSANFTQVDALDEDGNLLKSSRAIRAQVQAPETQTHSAAAWEEGMRVEGVVGIQTHFGS